MSKSCLQSRGNYFDKKLIYLSKNVTLFTLCHFGIVFIANSTLSDTHVTVPTKKISTLNQLSLAV